MKAQNVLNILLVGGIMTVLGLLIFQKPQQPIYPVSTRKVIEQRIEAKDTTINNYITQVIDEKKIVSALSKEINEVKQQLEEVKNQRDTFQIVQIQDTLISILSDENNRLYNIIDWQDSIIVAQRYIINSKDTLIAIARSDSQKYKRQRNRSIAGNAVQGIIIGGLLLIK